MSPVRLAQPVSNSYGDPSDYESFFDEGDKRRIRNSYVSCPG